MNKFTQMFQSKTFWALVVMVAYDILAAYGQYNPTLSSLVNLILGSVATYFKINTSTVYTPAGVTPPVSGQTVLVTQP